VNPDPVGDSGKNEGRPSLGVRLCQVKSVYKVRSVIQVDSHLHFSKLMLDKVNLLGFGHSRSL